MKNIIMISVVGLSLVGCAGSQIKNLDTDMEVKGSSTLGDVGIKDHTAIIQKQTNADDELRVQQWKNNQAEDKLTSEWAELKQCREDIADVRLGGKGEVTPMPSIDNMKPVAEIKEEFGLNKNGNLEFVTKEDFLKRVALERHYGETLATMQKTVQDSREDCERRLVRPRVAAGLPGHRNGSESLDHELAGRQSPTENRVPANLAASLEKFSSQE